MNSQSEDTPVHVIFRFPFKRPSEEFQLPRLVPAEPWTLEEQVWRCLLSLPGPDQPHDILAELEQDQVTFDWELLASTLQVPLTDVFVAASNLFQQHLGRPLELVEDSMQMLGRHSSRLDHGSKEQRYEEGGGEGVAVCSEQRGFVPHHELKRDQSHESLLDAPADARDFEQTGLQSVESLGNGIARAGSSSPVVELNTATPDNEVHRSQVGADGAHEQAGSQRLNIQTEPDLSDWRSRTSELGDEEDGMRQSLLAEAMASRVHQHQQPAHNPPPVSTRTGREPPTTSSSFSDLSNSSLTESAMQDALISEAMNASTAMSSLLGSRMFPWSKKR
ncbi:hypothetical protein GGI20_004292 [Coemansia sp. BCRC 34301]|nr:hypothetical protein GGI20_004292 [Coemansia sp. BCRC 34301]